MMLASSIQRPRYSNTMDKSLTQWLAPTCQPAEETASFQIRIRLNAREASRRLQRIRDRFLSEKERIVGFCQRIEHDRRLETLLLRADVELQAICHTLNGQHIGEREYLGTLVCELERLMEASKALFRKAGPIRNAIGYTWQQLNKEARHLVANLERQLSVLVRISQILQDEMYLKHVVGRKQTTTFMDWIHGWVCMPEARRKCAKTRVLEHQGMDHLYE